MTVVQLQAREARQTSRIEDLQIIIDSDSKEIRRLQRLVEDATIEKADLQRSQRESTKINEAAIAELERRLAEMQRDVQRMKETTEKRANASSPAGDHHPHRWRNFANSIIMRGQ